MITARGEYRSTILVGLVLLTLGALGFATFDADTPKWESLIFMALIGLGVGPQLSGLQIAMTRTVAPQMIGAGLGTLLLLRQVGIGPPVDGAEDAAHVDIEATCREVDILRLDHQRSATALFAPVFGSLEQCRSDARGT